jgi:hypothetical protein
MLDCVERSKCFGAAIAKDTLVRLSQNALQDGCDVIRASSVILIDEAAIAGFEVACAEEASAEGLH